ncbi:MAG: dihydrodipicolinate synthase family protein [Alphaproteobacteria bacterium]|nr:dihydrodipicolinate synthase family protein [Alphaproteobacteria bacterium]
MAGLAASGIFAAVLTPLNADLSPDMGRMVAHCRWLLAHGCDGLAILGTTGEANSFSVDERLAILDGVTAAGIPPEKLLPGTGACAFPDAVRLSRRALELGMAGVLTLPPFYYKNVSEDGVFAAYAETIRRVDDPRLRMFVYHFPAMSAVPVGFDVIARLRAEFGEQVAGIKDSSGDIAFMTRLVEAFPGFSVLSGSDHELLPVLKAGGAGAITAAANIACAMAADVRDDFLAGDLEAAEAAQAKLSAVRRVVSSVPAISAMKALFARTSGDPGWERVRPPLVPLSAEQRRIFFEGLDEIGFELP